MVSESKNVQCDLDSFFPLQSGPPSVRPSASVLCKRRSGGGGNAPSEQADRQLDNGSRLGKIRGKRTGEREKRASERVSEEGVGAIVHTWPELWEGEEEGERENGRLDCHTRLESKTYKFYVAANGASSIAPSLASVPPL